MLVRRLCWLALVPLVAVVSVLTALVDVSWLAATAPPAAADSVITVTGHDFTAPQGVDVSTHLFVAGVTPVVATFTDSNAAVTPANLSAAINWGDGTTTPGTITALSGAFGVGGNHIYATPNTFTVTVTVTDTTSPGTGSGTATATVTPQLAVTVPNVTIAEGASFSGPVATFTDAVNQNASALTATIDWGDGATTSGTIVLSGNSGTVSGSHAWAEDGTYTVTVSVTATDPVGATANGTGTATVTEADLTATPTAIHPVAGTALTAAVATFTDAGSPDSAADFTAVINWGDGSTTPGTVAGGSGTFTVTGTHTYTSAGTFTLTMTVTEIGQTSATATQTVVVTAAATTTTTSTSTSTSTTIATTSTTIGVTTTGAATAVPTTTTAAGSLPVTGGDFRDIVAIALGLLFVGAATVVVTGRARR